jgi:hypothetical protein
VRHEIETELLIQIIQIPFCCCWTGSECWANRGNRAATTLLIRWQMLFFKLGGLGVQFSERMNREGGGMVMFA